MQKTFAVMFEDPDRKVSPVRQIVAETGGNEILPAAVKSGTGIRTHGRFHENNRPPVPSQHAGLLFPRQSGIGIKFFRRDQTVPPGNNVAPQMKSELDHLIEPFDQSPVWNALDRRFRQMPHGELRMLVIDFHFSPLGSFCV